MDGSAFINLAVQLALANSEASLRTAVSRAYYGSFHAVRDYLLDLGIRVPATEQVHVKIAQVFGNAGHPALAEFGRSLQNVKLLRNKADYDLRSNQFATPPVARAAVERATRLLQVIHDCRTGPDRDAIRAALRQAAGALGLPAAP